MSENELEVSVVYALPERQAIVKLRVPNGTTVADAVERSSLASRFPEIAASQLNCAIFGRAVSNSQTLIEGDRVEILRPLIADPKENRRQAAARTRRK